MPYDVERPPAPRPPAADARKQLFRIGGVLGGLVTAAVVMMVAIFGGAGSEGGASNRTQSAAARLMGDRLLATDGHTLHQIAEPNPSGRLPRQPTRLSLQDQGFDCEPTGHDHLDCAREGDDGLQVRASADAESTHGLTGTSEQGSAFIRGNTDPHQEADFVGHHVTIDWGGPRNGKLEASDKLSVEISPVDSPVATEA